MVLGFGILGFRVECFRVWGFVLQGLGFWVLGYVPAVTRACTRCTILDQQPHDLYMAVRGRQKQGRLAATMVLVGTSLL